MRIANLSGRLSLVREDRALDVEHASGGRFCAEPQAVYGVWRDFRAWAASADWAGAVPFEPSELGAPAPAPRQVFGIGLNYRDHVAESGFGQPSGSESSGREEPEGLPQVFTKFVSSITGPVTDVALPAGGHTDWEVELVAVIGARARHVAQDAAWEYVAGLCAGQDISERVGQLAGAVPQFSLGKSYPGFSPMGPWLVTPDEFEDPDDLELRCTLNGDLMQKGRTRDLIFSVPALISRLSGVLPLLPGDVLFTGTPAGVGLGRDPQHWIASGDLLVSRIEGIGELRQRFSAQRSTS